MFLMASTRTGISAKQLEREIGVTYKTAWRMFKEIRTLMAQDDVVLFGEIEVDETYIGGKRPGKRGRGAAGKTIVAGMVERGKGGKIVFISSVHGAMPYQNAVAYNAAKAGLNHMAKTIARELAPHKINVNIIEPGWIDTPGEHESFGTEYLMEQGRALPWKRLGTPADIGKAATFLSSDAADYITGTIMRVDGGYVHKDT